MVLHVVRSRRAVRAARRKKKNHLKISKTKHQVRFLTLHILPFPRVRPYVVFLEYVCWRESITRMCVGEENQVRLLKQSTTTLYFGKALEDNENSFESQYSFCSSVDFLVLNKRVIEAIFLRFESDILERYD